jgi:DNA-binding transcriptional MerR regulator
MGTMNHQKAITKYSTFDIQKIFNISRNTLKQWIDRGFIVPSEQAEGLGTKNLFTREDLYRVALFQSLYLTGFSQRKAGEAAQEQSFDNVKSDRFEYIFLVVYLKRQEWQHGLPFILGQKEITKSIPTRLPKGHDGMIVIDLVAIKERVDDKLKD